MTSLPPLEYWFEALRQPVGVVILCSDRKRMQNALYTARKEAAAASPELMTLSLCVSPTAENELWIVHKKVKVMPDGEGS